MSIILFRSFHVFFIKLILDLVEISAVRNILNGYEAEISTLTGGIVVLNSPMLPFWKAFADDRQVPIVEANLVHMAVMVPPGTKKVTFQYNRPLLRDVIFDRLMPWFSQLT